MQRRLSLKVSTQILIAIASVIVSFGSSATEVMCSEVLQNSAEMKSPRLGKPLDFSALRRLVPTTATDNIKTQNKFEIEMQSIANAQAEVVIRFQDSRHPLFIKRKYSADAQAFRNPDALDQLYIFEPSARLVLITLDMKTGSVLREVLLSDFTNQKQMSNPVAAALGGNRIVIAQDQQVDIYEENRLIENIKIRKWHFVNIKILPIDKDHFVLKANGGHSPQIEFLVPIKIDSFNQTQFTINENTKLHHLGEAKAVVGVDISLDNKLFVVNYGDRLELLNLDLSLNAIIKNPDVSQPFLSIKFSADKIVSNTAHGALTFPVNGSVGSSTKASQSANKLNVQAQTVIVPGALNRLQNSHLKSSSLNLSNTEFRPKLVSRYDVGSITYSLVNLPGSRDMIGKDFHGVVKIFDIDTKVTKAQIKEKRAASNTIFSNDGKSFVFGTTAKHSSTLTNNPVGEVNPLTGEILNGEVRIGDSELGVIVDSIPLDYPVKAVQFAPNDEYLLVGSGSQFIIIDRVSKKEVFKVDLIETVNDLQISPSGRYVVAFTGQEKAKVIDLIANKKIYEVSSDDSWLSSMAMSLDDKVFAIGTHKNIAQIIELNTGKVFSEIKFDDWVQAMTFSADGKYLIAGDRKGLLKIIEVSTGIVVSEKPLGITSEIISIAKMSDGKSFIVSTKEGGKLYHFNLYSEAVVTSNNVSKPIQVLPAIKVKTKEESAYDVALLLLSDAEKKFAEVKKSDPSYSRIEARLKLIQSKVNRLARDLERQKNSIPVTKQEQAPLALAKPALRIERNFDKTADYQNGTPIVAFAKLDPGTFEYGDHSKANITFSKPLEIMSVLTTQKVWTEIVEMSGAAIPKYPSIDAGENFPVQPRSEIKDWFIALNSLSNSSDPQIQSKLQALFPGHVKGAEYRVVNIFEWAYAIKFMRLDGEQSVGSESIEDSPFFADRMYREPFLVGSKKPVYINDVPIYDPEKSAEQKSLNYYQLYGESDSVDPVGPPQLTMRAFATLPGHSFRIIRTMP